MQFGPPIAPNFPALCLVRHECHVGAIKAPPADQVRRSQIQKTGPARLDRFSVVASLASPRRTRFPVIALQIIGSPRIPTTALRPQTARANRVLQQLPAKRESYAVRSMQLCHTTLYAPQHLSSPIWIREISNPVGVILIDCLQLVVVTAIAAVNVGPWIDTLNPLPVKRPATEPTAA